MKRLPALAGALALLLPAATAGAQTYRHDSADRKVVVQIVYHRKMAWRWQDRAHHKRSETSYRERTAPSQVLPRLQHYWEHRHYVAWRAWKRYDAAHARLVTPSVDSCLSAIIAREGSGGDPHATNPSTGAYGIPQALPGSKMASAGADWADNPATQIRWMIGYVNERYGGSCAALAHSNAYGWY